MAVTGPIPFTLRAVAGRADWRRGFTWPLDYRTLRDAQLSLVSGVVAAVAAMPAGPVRTLAILTGVSAAMIAAQWSWIALHGVAARQAAVVLADAPDMVAPLLGDAPLPETGDAAGAWVKTAAPLRHAWARRLARTATLAGGAGRFARAVLAPGALALSHNPLMIAHARKTGAAVRFSHAERWLARARAASPGPDPAVAAAADALMGGLGPALSHLPDDVAARVARAVRRDLAPLVTAASADLAGFARVAPADLRLWAGTPSYYPVRALALAAAPKGGRLTSFDHGGSLSMVDEPDTIALRDLMVPDAYVMPGAEAVRLFRQGNPSAAPDGAWPVTLTAGAGDPKFRRAAAALPLSGGRRARVLYPTTVFRGIRQNMPPLLPDPVALDLQLSVVEAVEAAGLPVAVKPHPESSLYGLAHPLEGRVPLDRRPFAEALADADLLVFDYPQSTAFWEALCTDRPVILVDAGITRFHTAARALIDRRCRVVPAAIGPDGRVVPDAPALEAALTGALTAPDDGDPSLFAAVFAGDDHDGDSSAWRHIS